MLTFPTSHALTDALITAIQTPDLTARLPIVLFLYEVADTDTEHLIRCHVVRPRHSSGAEGLDTTIVGRLEALTRGHTDTQGPIPALMAAVHATTGDAPGFRMLACAALDDDIVIAANEPHGCRRLDAVDIDGRVYQLTRYHAETHPIVTVDDADEPRDTPATIPALQNALKIAVRLASRV
ncbi:hypothetical protein EV385_3067 [Krasilnikovia cinnamomea]|uniref:Uncharacterized protein n=1 Tax=Krasilnikovia cinnamomea TaxID=349313 RepID=A0A4Q7ZK22_9ACTN|nr:hypothetical protein [Krasilnikovia cinnamomea]RZU51257.1 hypothetical protein EV385_3067 [Krasilnikovia cinnamomea]